MEEYRYGGEWTEKKLTILGKYIAAYRTIFAANPRASYFTTWYVDAFAGTGKRALPEQVSMPLLAEVYAEAGTQTHREGSAAIALGVVSPFDRYLFIEKSKRRIQALRGFVEDKYPMLAACRT